MKTRWIERKDEFLQNALQNLPKNIKGRENGNVLAIEYYGKIYYGWRELKESTKVSKHLYRRYYIYGINSEPRIGKDGPLVKRKEGLQ